MMNQFNRHDDEPMPCPLDLYFPVDQKSVNQCQGKKLPGNLFFKREVLGLQHLDSDSLGPGVIWSRNNTFNKRPQMNLIQSGYGTNMQISNFQTEFPSKYRGRDYSLFVRHLRIQPWLCLSLFIPALNYTCKLQLRKYSKENIEMVLPRKNLKLTLINLF